MTCAAEVGGVAICFQLLSGLPYRLLIPVGVLMLVTAAWVPPPNADKAHWHHMGSC